MKFTISSEALLQAAEAVKSVTMGKSDPDFTYVLEAFDNGVEIRRNSLNGYAQFFIHCSGNEPGLVVLNVKALDVLNDLPGEVEIKYKEPSLVIKHEIVKRTTIKAQFDTNAFLHQRIEAPTEFTPVPDELKSLLWANQDFNDDKWGKVFLFGEYAGVVQTGGIRFASMKLDTPVEKNLAFTTSSISLLGKECYFAMDGENAWFKRGNFLFRTPCPADKDPFSLLVSFASADISGSPYFIVDTDKFLKVIRVIARISRSEQLNNQSRCYIHLMEGKQLYIEGNASEISEGVMTYLDVLEGSGDVEFCVPAEQLESAITQLNFDHQDKDRVKMVLLMDKSGKYHYPLVVGQKTIRLPMPVTAAWKHAEHSIQELDATAQKVE